MAEAREARKSHASESASVKKPERKTTEAHTLEMVAVAQAANSSALSQCDCENPGTRPEDRAPCGHDPIAGRASGTKGWHYAALLPDSFWTKSDKSEGVLMIPTLEIASPICPLHGEPAQSEFRSTVLNS